MDLVGVETHIHPSALYSVSTGWFSWVEGGLALSHVLYPPYTRKMGQILSASASPKCSAAAGLAPAFGAIDVASRGDTLVQLSWGQDWGSLRVLESGTWQGRARLRAGAF